MDSPEIISLIKKASGARSTGATASTGRLYGRVTSRSSRGASSES